MFGIKYFFIRTRITCNPHIYYVKIYIYKLSRAVFFKFFFMDLLKLNKDHVELMSEYTKGGEKN